MPQMYTDFNHFITVTTINLWCVKVRLCQQPHLYLDSLSVWILETFTSYQRATDWSYLQEQLDHARAICLNRRQQYHEKLSSLMLEYLEAPANSLKDMNIQVCQQRIQDGSTKSVLFTIQDVTITLRGHRDKIFKPSARTESLLIYRSNFSRIVLWIPGIYCLPR